jgi:hypothetical protein
MRRKSAVGHLPVGRPGQEPLLGHLIYQGKQPQMPFDQHRPGALVAAIFGGVFTNFSPLFFGYGIEPVLACLATGQDVSRMELAACATAVRFATLASEQIEGALDHGLGALETAQSASHGGIGTPELLTESGQISVQLYLLWLYAYRYASQKCEKHEKPAFSPSEGQKSGF